MYLDAANRKIKEPIDYLILASKRSRDTLIYLKLAGYEDLFKEAVQLNRKINEILDNLPIEEWETAKHSRYREVVSQDIKQSESCYDVGLCAVENCRNRRYTICRPLKTTGE